MTLDVWSAAQAPSELYDHLSELNDRKQHLLTTAFLRRVWDLLPSDHTRRAVWATERFVDGFITLEQLARLRSVDLLDSCESLWIDPHEGHHEEQLIGQGCYGCDSCDQRAAEYECRAAKKGYVLDGIASGVKHPEWIAVQAALRVREIVAWAAAPEERDAAADHEALAQFRVFSDVAGSRFGRLANSRWPEWRTQTVRLVARGIYRNRSFDQLPILADALQDAGCNDDEVLAHCREEKEHVRGCWVVDLAMGVT